MAQQFDPWARTAWSEDDQKSIEDEENFWGWHIKGSTTKALFCPTLESFETSGGFGFCCDGRQCETLKTSCMSETVHYDDGSTATCVEGALCRTVTLRHPEEPLSTVQDIFCAYPNYDVFDLWQQIPSDNTRSSDEMLATSVLRSTSDTGATPTSSELALNTNTSVEFDPGTSNGNTALAWVAGAVIAPVVLIAALVFCIWWCKRRAARKSGASHVSQQPASPNNAQRDRGEGLFYLDPQMSPGYFSGYKQELHADSLPPKIELPTGSPR